MARFRCRVAVLLAAVVLGGMGSAAAADFPTRPIRWIVPYPAGGTTDILSRIMAEFLSQRLGQPVIIENKPGAANNIATQAAISAPPDGHTILLTATTNAINATFYEKLPFNFMRDIAPVGGFVTLPFVLIATPAFPAKTVPELVAYAKANPGKVNMGSFGTGTISHLAIELFKLSTGVDVVHVPYRSGVPLVTDMFAGRVRDRDRRHAEFAAAHPTRRVARARDHQRQALARRARRADDRRKRPRLCGRRLDRRRRAERHARRCHRHTQPRTQCRARRSGGQGAARRSRRHAVSARAGGIRRLRRGGDREVGQGRARRRPQSGDGSSRRPGAVRFRSALRGQKRNNHEHDRTGQREH